MTLVISPPTALQQVAHLRSSTVVQLIHALNGVLEHSAEIEPFAVVGRARPDGSGKIRIWNSTQTDIAHRATPNYEVFKMSIDS
jgi:CO/xanthine dehydrogenase Mo-binding subunit